MRRFALAALTCLLLSAAVQAQKIEIKPTEGVDFSHYKTFGLVQGYPAREPVTDDYIKISIINQMQQRGWKPADPKNADVLVAYYAASDTEISFGSMIDPGYIMYGYAATTLAPVWASQAMTGSTTYVHKGDFTIRVYDGKFHAPIYVAQGKGYAATTGTRLMKQIDKVVPKMMEKFPQAGQ